MPEKEEKVTDLLLWRGIPVPNEHIPAHAFNINNEDMPDGAYFAMSEDQGITMEDHQAYAEWQSEVHPE